MRYLIAVCALFVLAGCGFQTESYYISTSETEPAPCQTVEYGSNVVHFRCNGNDFLYTLSVYKRENPTLEAGPVFVVNTTRYGVPLTYGVSFEPRS